MNIIKEQVDFIASNPHSDAESVLDDPSSLVGKETSQISDRFW